MSLRFKKDFDKIKFNNEFNESVMDSFVLKKSRENKQTKEIWIETIINDFLSFNLKLKSDKSYNQFRKIFQEQLPQKLIRKYIKMIINSDMWINLKYPMIELIVRHQIISEEKLIKRYKDNFCIEHKKLLFHYQKEE